MRCRRDLFAPILLAASLACDTAGPIEPSPGKPQFLPLMVQCDIAPDLRCTASRFGEGDITSRVSWTAADSFRLAMDVPVTASSAVDFPAPGRPRVLRAASVYLRADYVSPQGHLRAVAPLAFALEPGGGAVPLSYISGTAYIGPAPATGGGRPLGGVTIEIVQGEGAGKMAMTLESNGFYMIEFLRLGAPFIARASKPGYDADVKAHAGIVHGETGFPANTILHFHLTLSQ